MTVSLLAAGAASVNAQDSSYTNTTSTTTTVSSSSNTGSSGVRAGLRVGANLSTVVKDGDYDLTTGSKIGVNAALFVELPIVSVFSIQPEIQFSQKGYKANGSYLGTPYEYKRTSNFFEVPILAKIKPSSNFAILVGPQYSYLASTKTKFTVSNASYETVVDEDNDNLRKNILGGVAGIEVSADRFVADLRYNLDFQKNNGNGTSSSLRYKNQVVALSVGFIF